MAENVTYFHACNLASSKSVKSHRLRKQLAFLSNKQANGKEFVSLYIPDKVSIDQIQSNLRLELNSAEKVSNGKDRAIYAIKNVIQHFSDKTIIPEPGLALFAGAIFDEEFQLERFIIEEIVPPDPIPYYHLSVDYTFDLQPLREMLRDQKIIGVIVLDAKNASFGVLINESFQFLENINSGVPGKSSKGGQSQRRYERERDMEMINFFHRVGEHATKKFAEKKVNVLVVGGPGKTKNDFLKGDYLQYELMNSIVNIADTQTATEPGLKEALAKSEDEIANMCGPEEKRIVQRLLKALNKDGLATYGLLPVFESLKKGEVEVVLVTDDTEFVEVTASCKKCGLKKSKIFKDVAQAIREILSVPCERCRSTNYDSFKKDIVDVLEDFASETGAIVEVISTQSKEKDELISLGGIAALLRYKN